MKVFDSVGLPPAQVITLPNEVENHDHDHHQLVIALKGYSEFCIEGTPNFIVPGQGCIVTTSSEHAFNGVGESEILTLNLPYELSVDTQIVKRIEPLFSSNQYFRLDRQFQSILQLLVLEMKESPDDILLAEACKNTVIAMLHRHMHLDFPNKLSLKNRINMTIIDNYILQHIANKITVAQLAGCVFLGESQFHLLFKQQVGMTPHQYILQMRLNLAKKLLADHSMSLSAIATASGFANQSSFTHSFTKTQGTSPSKYRH
ncbi:AraC family transcriptional regulator [Psychromonas sp. 14N.309.X.WAT.B.A12]|uniref:AraC family transcriptional regulator n=1 Tax=Psychromonas sp. 14N.309.X.WAT.B.A12 TaxID=2998322 RepID=UPI0025AF95D5|nr:AraC family transcriptional regulator [Psychromonas sp. 14N.309.X.WAT.B.A12]MDN2662092.1 AraC family transcriptional regulator [Psychromonas sp. 14N.309.X.WAT.B.A12]